MPECPDPFLMSLHDQMKHWDHLPVAGGLLDQPYMLMIELAAVARASELSTPKDSAS